MKPLFYLLFIIVSNLAFSQDIITLVSGEKLEVKIIENEKSKVKYKKTNNLEGPVYVIDKVDIAKITYANGDEEIISKSSASETKDQNKKDFKDKEEVEFSRLKEKSMLYNKKRNLFSFNYANMLLLNMEFSYEIIVLKSGFLGIKIPVSVGMNLRNEYLRKNNIISTGVHINIYPLGQGKVSYLTGPALRYFYMNDNPNHFNSSSMSSESSHYIGFYMNNGVLFQATSFLNFSLGLGLGTRRDVGRPDEPSTFDVIFDGSIIFRL